jgi:hypothetical protein
MAIGIIVTVITIKIELDPLILIPASIFRERRLSITTAMDSPTERTTLSLTFIRLKKTSVQAKPGKKNINIKAKSALTMDKPSRVEEVDSSIPLSQSTP